MLRARYDLYTRKYTYLEPSLVEVINIPFLDRVFIDYITYESKPRVYHVGIFILGSLIIDSTSETRYNLGISLYETVYLSGSNARRAAYGPKAIGYFSKVGEPGLKSSRIKVEYPLKKDLFFEVGQFSKVGWYFESWLLSSASMLKRASRDLVDRSSLPYGSLGSFLRASSARIIRLSFGRGCILYFEGNSS